MRFVPGRTRSRWLLATGTAATCIAVVVAGTVAANAAEEKSPAPKATASQPSASQPSAAPLPPDLDPAEPVRTTLGEIISSGLKTGNGEWVFYGVTVQEPAVPGIEFGIMAGRRLAGGELTADVMANEVVGSATAPGFHAVSGSMNADGRDTPTFGYYAGPAAKITAKVGGRTVTASQAVWSENPSVVVFWFAPKSSVKNLAAFDAAGKKLPTGNSEVGVG